MHGGGERTRAKHVGGLSFQGATIHDTYVMCMCSICVRAVLSPPHPRRPPTSEVCGLTLSTEHSEDCESVSALFI